MASANDKQNFVNSLRGMVNRQKALLFEEFEKEQAIARKEFEELVAAVLATKDKQMNVFARQLEMSDEPLDRQELTQCKRVQSLMCLKYKQGQSVTPGSLRSAGYIQSCTASPQDLFFVEDYRLAKFKKGDSHRVYYECNGSYDPCLNSFLTVAVRNKSNKEQNTSNRDLMNGVYLMEFVAGEEGMYSVHVMLYGQHISGSPFHIEVCRDSVKEENKPPGLGRDQPASGDGPSQTGLPLRALTQAPSGEMSHRYEMRDDAHGRCPEQPQVRPAMQAANLEAPSGEMSHRYEMRDDAHGRRPEQPQDRPAMQAANLEAPSGEMSHRYEMRDDAYGRRPEQPQVRPAMQAANLEAPSGEMSHRYEMRDDAYGRRPEQPQVRPSMQAANLEVPAQRHEMPEPRMHPEPNNLGTCANASSNAVFPQKQSALGFSTTPAVAGHMSAPKPLQQNVSSDAAWNLKAPDARPAPAVESTRKAGPPKPSTRPAAKAPLKKGSFTAELIFEFNTFRRKKFCFPIGVTATAQGVIILADTGSNKVLMMDSRGGALREVSLPDALDGFKRPSAVVAQADGTFAVKDDRCIYAFSKDGDFIRALGKGVLSRPYGLAFEGRENLLTLSLGESPPTLRTYSVSGDFEKGISYGPLIPCAPHNSKCRFMEVHGDDLYVSDLGLSSIYKTDLRGEMLKTFGSPGKAPGMLNEPSGLSATEDYLFVGDSKNNRVQVFDFDGNFISVVNMRCPVVRPSGLYVSPNNVLYVVNYLHGAVGMYQLTFKEKP
ncbi:uncharacterized protein LOC144178811 [Haemaphysalis longicornis]